MEAGHLGPHLVNAVRPALEEYREEPVSVLIQNHSLKGGNATGKTTIRGPVHRQVKKLAVNPIFH